MVHLRSVLIPLVLAAAGAVQAETVAKIAFVDPLSGPVATIGKGRVVHKVFLISQNYAFGQQVARAAKEYLARKRPDVVVVGDELHPLGQVKDFAPYVAKIKASGADTVVTANWGNDLSLLVRAMRDSGLDTNVYTLGGGYWGAPTAIGEAGVGK